MSGHAGTHATGWSALVPVKRLAVAKSRLRGALPGTDHAELVLAMAADTVQALLAATAVRRVLVVTDDPRVARELGALGAEPVADPGGGLNAALRRAAAALPGPVAAVTADLPALTAAEVTGALTAAAAGPGGAGFVADAAGTGTALLAAGRGAALRPRFGPGSAAAHRAAGLAELAGAWPGLRRDVDTAADLAAAAALGLGPRTAARFALAGRGSPLR